MLETHFLTVMRAKTPSLHVPFLKENYSKVGRVSLLLQVLFLIHLAVISVVKKATVSFFHLCKNVYTNLKPLPLKIVHILPGQNGPDNCFLATPPPSHT